VFPPNGFDRDTFGGQTSYMESSTRPWGSYLVLSDDADHKVKRITVDPGMRLSYQRHFRRSEHWFFVQGEGKFVLDEVETVVRSGSAVDIAVGSAHRIENLSESVPLVFIEIQHGSYFGEDDIIRLDDDFGRADEASDQVPGTAPR
jgi:mannose-6-phosphate isomerase